MHKCAFSAPFYIICIINDFMCVSWGVFASAMSLHLSAYFFYEKIGAALPPNHCTICAKLVNLFSQNSAVFRG